MIISASRRTDIPNYYSDWFFNRLKEGYLYVRNPMNLHQVSKINVSPEVVDCIVFWTKNPEPMMERYDPCSPILCGLIETTDKITERKVKSFCLDASYPIRR